MSWPNSNLSPVWLCLRRIGSGTVRARQGAAGGASACGSGRAKGHHTAAELGRGSSISGEMRAGGRRKARQVGPTCRRTPGEAVRGRAGALNRSGGGECWAEAWAAGKKKGKRAGLSWGRKRIFFLPNSLKQIQIKFKLKEFEFKLNHKHLKQCKVAWMHNNKTTSFNFIKPTNHYLFFTKFCGENKCWDVF